MPPNTYVINEVSIEVFHTVYNVQVYNIQTQALFDTGASINAISFKFSSFIQQQIKLLPTNRKVVSADGNILGPVGEVHLKFKVGSITKVDSAENVQNIYSLEHPHVKASVEVQPSDPLLPTFPNHSSFTTHAHDSNKSPIQLQDANIPLEIQHKLCTGIISKSLTDFGRTNLIEMDLPTTGPPVSTKPYTIPLKYKSFTNDEIKLLKDARCIF